jgi:hypothetical protein
MLTVNPKNNLFMEIPWEAVNRRNINNIKLIALIKIYFLLAL